MEQRVVMQPVFRGWRVEGAGLRVVGECVCVLVLGDVNDAS